MTALGLEWGGPGGEPGSLLPRLLALPTYLSVRPQVRPFAHPPIRSSVYSTNTCVLSLAGDGQQDRALSLQAQGGSRSHMETGAGDQKLLLSAAQGWQASWGHLAKAPGSCSPPVGNLSLTPCHPGDLVLWIQGQEPLTLWPRWMAGLGHGPASSPTPAPARDSPGPVMAPVPVPAVTCGLARPGPRTFSLQTTQCTQSFLAHWSFRAAGALPPSPHPG